MGDTTDDTDDHTFEMLDSVPDIRVKVVGVGGAGNNTVTRLSREGALPCVETIALNTDKQHLLASQADQRMVIGEKLTGGLGAGGDPARGLSSAKEHRSGIKDMVRNAELVFVTAGLGGGTGSGAAPYVAQCARDAGALVIAAVTLPFHMEGPRRRTIARESIAELERAAHTVVTIDNNTLLERAPNEPIGRAFSMVDDVLFSMLRGVSGILTTPALVNIDLADVKQVMREGGHAVVGLGRAKDGKKGREAVRMALDQTLSDGDYRSATGALLHITGGPSLKLEEALDACDTVHTLISPSINSIWGACIDERFEDYLQVMTIVTGLPSPMVEHEATDDDGLVHTGI
ncbi:MAG TPA: cell division protein FtsZ [Methanomicrobia archaeon]|nr:cell division protein FtsZ [Methanomicrobia archaeon]